jgi:hypothetical protein
MSTPNDNHDPNLLPESSGVVVKPIAMFLVILTLATAFVFVLVKGLTYTLEKLDEANAPQPSSQVAGGGRLPQREPLLQGAPQVDPANPNEGKASLLPLDEMREYREKTEIAAESYGWVAGKENAEAHIPIERAKALLLERGLPVKVGNAVAEIQAAETTRQQVYSADSSAGRLIGKQ